MKPRTSLNPSQAANPILTGSHCGNVWSADCLNPSQAANPHLTDDADDYLIDLDLV